jgi:hypothetical protein
MGLEVGFELRANKAGALPLEPHKPVHFALVILEMRSLKLFPWLALNQDPLDLSLPSS